MTRYGYCGKCGRRRIDLDKAATCMYCLCVDGNPISKAYDRLIADEKNGIQRTPEEVASITEAAAKEWHSKVVEFEAEDAKIRRLWDGTQ